MQTPLENFDTYQHWTGRPTHLEEDDISEGRKELTFIALHQCSIRPVMLHTAPAVRKRLEDRRVEHLSCYVTPVKEEPIDLLDSLCSEECLKHILTLGVRSTEPRDVRRFFHDHARELASCVALSILPNDFFDVQYMPRPENLVSLQISRPNTDERDRHDDLHEMSKVVHGIGKRLTSLEHLDVSLHHPAWITQFLLEQDTPTLRSITFSCMSDNVWERDWRSFCTQLSRQTQLVKLVVHDNVWQGVFDVATKLANLRHIELIDYHGGLVPFGALLLNQLPLLNVMRTSSMPCSSNDTLLQEILAARNLIYISGLDVPTRDLVRATIQKKPSWNWLRVVECCEGTECRLGASRSVKYGSRYAWPCDRAWASFAFQIAAMRANRLSRIRDGVLALTEKIVQFLGESSNGYRYEAIPQAALNTEFAKREMDLAVLNSKRKWTDSFS